MIKPFFSVIIPTYNRCELLKLSIESVLSQNYKNFEIIVIDNNSKDNTEKIVKKFKKKNIIFKKINNKGVISKSRNKGIKISKGKWIAFLDSDDTWHKNKLEKVYKIIMKNKKLDVVCNDEWIIKKNTNKKNIWGYGPYKKDFYKHLLESENCLSVSASVVKRQFLKENKIIFSERKNFITAEDFDFFLNIAFKKGIFYFLHLPLGNHLFHSKQLSKNELFLNKSSKEVQKYHIYKIQKFTENKKEIWNKVVLFVKFKQIISTLRKEKISINIIKKIFHFYLSNPFFSLLFSYKLVKRRLFGFYLTIKFIILQNSL